MNRTDNVNTDSNTAWPWLDIAMDVFPDDRALTDEERASYRRAEERLFRELHDDPIYQKLTKRTEDVA